MSEVSLSEAFDTREHRIEMEEREEALIRELRAKGKPLPAHLTYPRTETKELSDGTYEFTYIDRKTMVSKRIA